ncbi:LysR family transcriptional regulator ArgP [Rhizobium sp. YIM 134829]|uniref:LysR family transcriptional regulator ArgP n=1 Tax=Rhizobium sp. YIM 134829 TaxID=3390453 RepID=UPI0039781088
MLDYAALRVLAAVVEAGSFERAALRLNVTPSAVSQRIRQMEERLGVVLVVRGSPSTATEAGDWLCRHYETVSLLETELGRSLPALKPADPAGFGVTIPLAVNADSLDSWFVEALARFSQASAHRVRIAVDDQDHTAEWLERGRVLAAVTSLETTVPGCRRHALGALRYRATASPELIARLGPEGVTAESLARVPILIFDEKDQLQTAWMQRYLGRVAQAPVHWLPSTASFMEASLSGIGWGMNPDLLTRPHLSTGRLVELLPNTPLDIPLSWQLNHLAADPLKGLTAAVMAVAGERLVRG